MSLADDLKPKAPGKLPTAFDALRSRRDWQTAKPASADERKWYAVGYEMASDREMADPVSPLVPPTLRFFYSLGLADGLLKTPSRVAIPPAEKGSVWTTIAIVAGGAGAILGLGLILAAGSDND